MPKLIRRVPKYRKHASGNGMVTLNGKDIYLGEWGTAKSRRWYDRLIGEWKANNRVLPPKLAGGDISIAELIHAYWKFAEGYYAVEEGHSTGERNSVKLMLRILKKTHADIDVTDFGPLALRAVRQAMVAEGWSRKYVNTQVIRIRRMFQWGVGQELVKGETWHALTAVEPLSKGKTKAREIKPITTVDDCYIDAVFPWLNRHVQGMVRLQQITGMRPGELVIIRGVDINTKNPQLWEYRPSSHKTENAGHDRIIYFNADSQAVLQPFLKSDVTAYLFDPREAEAERRAAISAARKTPLTCGNKPGSNRRRKPRREPGPRYDVDSYRRAITRACDLANSWAKGGVIIANDTRAIPHWHPHQIRHNTATRLRAQHGLEAAQVILGHRTLSATQIYAEKNVEKAKRIMQGGN